MTDSTSLKSPAAAADEVPPAQQPTQAFLIGLRLKALRKERGFTIAGLAAAAGMSAGLISQIERGNSNPSLKTLEKLREVLGANIWAFHDVPKEPSEATFVRRASNRPKVVVGANGFSKELLSPQSNESMRFMILTIPPGAQNNETLTGPGGKGGYVIEGEVLLTVGDEAAALSHGDSFQFSSAEPHRIENHSSETARVLWIISIQDAHF